MAGSYNQWWGYLGGTIGTLRVVPNDASDYTSVCTGDDEKDALIRKTGVLGGEDNVLNTEERTGAGEDGVFVGNDDFVATDDVFAVTDTDDAFDVTGTDADDVFDAAFDAAFVATDTFVATFDATATDTPSPFPAKVCGTGRRMTSEGSDVSPPRVTRFAFPNTSEGETDRFSDLLSGANPCEATEAARGREGTSN